MKEEEEGCVGGGGGGGRGLWCGVDLNLTVQADFSRLNAPGRAGCAQPGDRSDQSRVRADPTPSGRQRR